jgi:glycosyltransferase involved in cell wall biosynthesis
MTAPRRKAIIVVSEDWYFLSHRFELALFLQRAGWDVRVITQVNRPEDAAKISGAGLRLTPLRLERGKLFAVSDVRYLWRLIRLYREERPALIHHVAMKPILYGSLAALTVPRAGVVNALAGLGYLFTHSRGRVRVVRKMVLVLFRRLFARKQTRVILQNAEDMAFFREELRVPAANLRLVRGSGVATERFQPVVHGPRERPVAVMVARLLRDKGVHELVDAARILRRQGIAVRVQLVGGVDEGNPNSLTQAEAEALHAEGVVEWLGHRTDVPAIFAQADIAVLPSYREGLPKSMLEAAASGLPLVATDTSGCRELVADGDNGLLVPVGDARRLAEALRQLVLDWNLRAKLGARSRERAEKEFPQDAVFARTAAIYEEVAGG